MGYYSEYTSRWLDQRYAERDAAGCYYAHMPIYGLHHPCAEGGHLVRFARALQILRTLNRLEFDSCLDVGGGEGYMSHVIRERFGARVVSADLSAEACARAQDLFGVDAVAVDSGRLPFPDKSFDVVLCSEVVEHVEFAVETLLELERVARVAVVLTTEEFQSDRAAIALELSRRNGYPHGERNFLHPDDLRALFGDGIEMGAQFRHSIFESAAETVDEARGALREATAFEGLVANGLGVVLLHRIATDATRAEPLCAEEDLLDSLLVDSLVAPNPLVETPRAAPPAALVERLVDPETHAPLAVDEGGGVLQTADGRSYPLRKGIPVMLGTGDPTREELVARLGRKLPEDAARRDAILALRDQLMIVNDPHKRRWDFANPEDRRDWVPAESMEALPGGTGRAFRATDNDPWFAGPGLRIPAATTRKIVLRMRLFNPDYPVEGGEGQLFFMSGEDRTLDESRVLTFPVRNLDSVETYELDVGGHPGWPKEGEVIFLRLDPANGPCEIELHGIEIHV